MALRVVVGGGLALLAGFAAPSAFALSMHRGDVLTSVGGSIQLHAPDGALRATFARGTGASTLCVDAGSGDVIAPGVGLFDRMGRRLASRWAADPSAGAECAVDGQGHVYLGGGPSGPSTATVRQYDVTGTLRNSFTVAAVDPDASGTAVYGLDVSPDPCTIYYNLSGGGVTFRYNVCTQTQEASLGAVLGGRDQLRVLPDFGLAQVFDGAVQVFDPTGQQSLESWGVPVFGLAAASEMRFVSLDPDGRSMWVGSLAPTAVWRLDFTTGQTLISWPVSGCGNSAGCGVDGLAVFAPAGGHGRGRR